MLARETAGEPPEALGSRGVSVGTVKYWLEEKGHGAIEVAELAPWDVWCHFGQIEMPGSKHLTPGQRVEVEWYRARQESYRFRAARVRPLPDPSAPPDAEDGSG
jgi:CspA family cold shock protein